MLNYVIFFAGVLTTLLTIVIIKRYNKRSRAKRMIINQSSMFFVIKALMPDIISLYKDKSTQALSYDSNKSFKYIEMPDHKAYWLDKNKIYYAEISEDGRFNPAEGKPSEMKNLSEKQVGKMLFIYNSLKNG